MNSFQKENKCKKKNFNIYEDVWKAIIILELNILFWRNRQSCGFDTMRPTILLPYRSYVIVSSAVYTWNWRTFYTCSDKEKGIYFIIAMKFFVVIGGSSRNVILESINGWKSNFMYTHQIELIWVIFFGFRNVWCFFTIVK